MIDFDHNIIVRARNERIRKLEAENKVLKAENKLLREEKAAKQWYPIQEGDYGNKDTTI